MPKTDDKTTREPIHGVFSTLETRKIGTGTTLRKTKVKQYWLVHELGKDDLAEVQPINENLIPTGKKRNISIDTLLDRFTPEPDFYIKSEVPEAPDKGGSVLDLDDAPLATPAPPSGEAAGPEIEGFELVGEPEDIEKNARASFGLGLTYLKRGNMTKAVDIFNALAETDAPFAPEHKHMFNEFGISLRKERLLDTALKCYLKALALAPDSDENLAHNIARAYFEKKDIPNAVKYLEESLKINPDLKESKLFLKFLKRKHSTAFEPISF